MNSRIPLAVAIPQTALDGRFDPSFLRQFLSRAEALGFSGGWVLEQILSVIPILEPVELLTYAAAVTERLRLGTAVLLTGVRSPVHLAKSLVTLDHLSGGRLDVGVGLGGRPDLYPATGVPSLRRAARFTEGLRLMKRIWTEPRVTFKGEFWNLEDAASEPKPLQRPHPPLWFGGHHPNALRRAIEMGHGFIGAGSIPGSRFAEQVRQLQTILAEVGRDPKTFPIGKRVYMAIDTDRARAARRLAEWFGLFYRNAELAAQVCVWGEPGECADGLREVIEGGAQFLLLNPVFDELEHLDLIASKVGPRL